MQFSNKHKLNSRAINNFVHLFLQKAGIIKTNSLSDSLSHFGTDNNESRSLEFTTIGRSHRWLLLWTATIGQACCHHRDDGCSTIQYCQVSKCCLVCISTVQHNASRVRTTMPTTCIPFCCVLLLVCPNITLNSQSAPLYCSTVFKSCIFQIYIYIYYIWIPQTI